MSREMKPPWDRWPKPWTRERCRRRYVEGDRIGLRQLGTVSGQSKGTIEVWCRAESWPEVRRQFQEELRTKTDEKTVEKLSDQLSSEMADLSTEHLRDYQLMRATARKFFEEWNRLFNSISDPDELRKVLTSVSPAAVGTWRDTLDKAIRGERMSAGLEYEDINKAILKVKSAGYTVDEPVHDENPPATQD